MTADEFAEALRRVVSDAEEAGLDRETLLAVFDDMREAMRACDD